MDNQDKKISKLYKEIYSNTHTSAEFKESVRTMTEKNKKKTKISFKVIGVLVAMAVLMTAGSMIVSASRGVYDTIIINGEEKKARFGDFGNNVRVWGYEEGNTSYMVYVFGDFDTENETLYFVDYGDYFLASTNSEPTLNLYTDIDKSSNAVIEDKYGKKVLCVTDDSGTQEIMLSFDDEDGTSDGKITFDENTVETYAILPNGSVVNTTKEKMTLPKKILNSILGNSAFNNTESSDSLNWEKFWGSFDSDNFWESFSSNN